MTYVLGKLGRSVSFFPEKWGAIGGDCEPPMLFLALAKNNPEDNFIIIGKSDYLMYSKKHQTPDNLYDIMELHDEQFPNISPKDRDPHYVQKTLKNIHVDGGIIAGGPTGTTNIKDCALRRQDLKENKEVFALTLEMHLKYSAPIYDYLNNSNIPWVSLVYDPRYLKVGRDMLNPPNACLSQYNMKYKYRTLYSFEDQKKIKETEINVTYSGLEKNYLIENGVLDTDTETETDTEKTEKFMIVLNEGNNGVKSRYPELKKWVLDNNEDVKIYGKWAPETVKGDSRFKGSIPYSDLQKMLKHVKYTFIIPIQKGWVTMKFWEMIQNGIIPFFHPHYDEQKHLEVPEFLRLKKPEDLAKRIKKLEDNPEIYKKLLMQLQNMITPDDVSGKTLTDTIINSLQQHFYDLPEKEPFVAPKKIEIDELDDW